MFEKYYEPESFPTFEYYIGDPAIYLVFLVLRFYDDVDDFARKLKSVFPFMRVMKVRKTFKFWETSIVLRNTLNGQIVELDKRDDPFTTAIKIFRTVGGAEWLQEPVFFRAFEEILPRVIWNGIPLIPHY